MKYTNKDIIAKLEGYKELRRIVRQLEYEISNLPQAVSGEEVIESMAFGSQFSEHIPSERTSDRTADIAITYSTSINQMNLRLKEELERDLAAVKLEKDRMEYYIGLLDENAAEVIRAIYFDRLTFRMSGEKLKIALVTVQNRHKKGIEKLKEMYNRIVV